MVVDQAQNRGDELVTLVVAHLAQRDVAAEMIVAEGVAARDTAAGTHV